MAITTHLPFGFQSWSAPTYNEIHESCRHIARYIKFNDRIKDVDLIVGIARGGLLPATIISHFLAIPMQTIFYSSKIGRGDNQDHNNELRSFTQHHILLVDDLTDTGNTMNELYKAYMEKGHKVTTAVIYYKELPDAHFEPDVWAVKVTKNFGWITFPFEENNKI